MMDHADSPNGTEAAKAALQKTADQGARMADATRDGVNKMEELREQSAENTRQLVQTGLAVASHQAREAGDRFTRTLGIGSEDSQRLTEQSKRNLEAVARCGSVVTHALQDASRGWIELSRNQWRRSFNGAQRLAHTRTAHEFAAVQSELLRESFQQLVEDGRTISERSLRAGEEAARAFADTASRDA